MTVNKAARTTEDDGAFRAKVGIAATSGIAGTSEPSAEVDYDTERITTANDEVIAA